MAHEWYVQHGGKQYGPMTPANLKKLATEGKITPATQVRPGAQGAWVSASKVQGLFTPAAAPAAQAQPARPVVPKAEPLAPPPLAAAVPQTASRVAPPPWAKPAHAASAAPAEAAGIAAKILGAVAIIFGAVALATFWLPVLSGPIGWTGIVVGGLGLVIGIGGLVVAAMSRGAGLVLNIAGTSSSAVGLVLAVVLGVTFGLFTSGPPPQVVVQRPTLPPVIVPQEEPPPRPTEPEPPPEPEWTNASGSIQQGPIKASIAGVAIEQVRLESSDISTMKRQPPQPMLRIRVVIENTTTDKIVEVPGWMGGGGALQVDLGSEVGKLLEGSDLGKAVQSTSAVAKLIDGAGNSYPQIPAFQVSGAQIRVGEDNGVRPGQTTQAELVFRPPLESIEYLRLELSSAGFGGSDALRFQIPRASIKGMPSAAGGG